jgi:hypothetical protein
MMFGPTLRRQFWIDIEYGTRKARPADKGTPFFGAGETVRTGTHIQPPAAAARTVVTGQHRAVATPHRDETDELALGRTPPAPQALPLRNMAHTIPICSGCRLRDRRRQSALPSGATRASAA